MVYNLAEAYDLERFSQRCAFLSSNGRTVELTERRRRSIPQNSLLHYWCGYLGLHLGETADYVKQNYFKRAVNPDIFVETRHDELLDADVETIRSSRTLTQEQMSACLEKFRLWTVQMTGLHLPNEEDRGFEAMLKDVDNCMYL